MKVLSKIFLICFSIFLFLNAAAQPSLKTVRGQVVDYYSQTPISFVEISYADKDGIHNLLTDTMGNFAISVHTEYNIKLLFRHVSYEPYIYENELPKGEIVIELKVTTETMEKAIISAIRSEVNNPTTATVIQKAGIEKVNFGQDLPMLLNLTPSTVVSADAGAGVGYTGIRIRGVDQTRINVTINGIPLNDAESHGVFWVNMPDFASSANSIQIQRGVGTSTNGSSAFGASLNVKTDHIDSKPFASSDIGFGSFNTKKLNAQFGTGVLASNWGLQGRFSAIQSDGFIDRASSDLKSVFLTAAHYGKKDLLKINFMAGHERTYQAWYGVPQPKFNGDTAATNRFIDELYFNDTQRNHLLKSNDLTYNPYTYENQVDNYDQHHLQLFYNKKLTNRIHWNSGVHYTHGFGYYEEFRVQDPLSNYNLPDFQMGGDTITNGDFIRRRWLNNHFFGGITSVDVELAKSSLIVGGGFHQYLGQHYGELIWAQYTSGSDYEQRYYDNDASKQDGNMYAKYTKRQSTKLITYLDLQMRWVNYKYQNPNDGKEYDASFQFFNPKAGLVYKWRKNQTFNIFLAVANREPVRDDFVSTKVQNVPSPERLYNLELGDLWQLKKLTVKVNYFMMYYTDQLVLSGELNDVGAYIRTNIPQSYRTGLETEVGWKVSKKLTIDGNLTISRNKIIEFTEFVDNWNTGEQVKFEQKNKSLAFSPNHVGSMVFNYTINQHWTSQLNLKTVGNQFLDNSESADRMLEAFTIVGFQTGYTIGLKAGGSVQIGAQLNNLLNLRYAPNGYTFGSFDGTERKSYNYVYPMAGRNAMLRLKVTL